MIGEHPRDAYIISFARLIERASYYGFRVLLVFIIMEQLHIDRKHAIPIYLSFTMFIHLAKVVGGFIGDFVLGSTVSIIIGGILQALGALTVFLDSPNTLYIALGLLIAGNALISPNIIALFGKLYWKKPHLINSGYNLFYSCVSIGAFVGVAIVGVQEEQMELKQALILCSVLSIVAAALMLFVKPEIKAKQKVKTHKSFKPVIIVSTAILSSAFFWVTYEYYSMATTPLLSDSNNLAYGDIDLDWYFDLNSYFAIGLTLLGFVVWSQVKMKSSYQIVCGAFIAAFSISLLYLVPDELNKDSISIFVSAFILMALSEVMLVPAVLAIFAKFSNPKYLATIYGLSSAVVYGVVTYGRHLTGKYNLAPSFYVALKVSIIFFVIIGIVMLAIGFFTPEKSNLEEEEEEANLDLLDQ